MEETKIMTGEIEEEKRKTKEAWKWIWREMGGSWEMGSKRKRKNRGGIEMSLERWVWREMGGNWQMNFERERKNRGVEMGLERDGRKLGNGF